MNKTTDEQQNNEPIVNNPSVGIFGGCAVQFLGAILFLTLVATNVSVALLIGMLSVIVGGLLIVRTQKRFSKENDTNDEWQKKEHERKNRVVSTVFKPQYDTICADLHKPTNLTNIDMVDNGLNLKYSFIGTELDCWTDDTNLYLIGSWNSITSLINMHIDSEFVNKAVNSGKIDALLYKKIISLDSIHFYKQDGEIYNETKITGGGGGGSSIKGAIVGGIVAGNAGAIIGSRNKIEGISSETIEHDDRKITLYYRENKTSENLSELVFAPEAYVGLLSIIPQKEFNAVMATEHSESNISITKQIKELAELKNEGILTDEEFLTKKKELLSKI